MNKEFVYLWVFSANEGVTAAISDALGEMLTCEILNFDQYASEKLEKTNTAPSVVVIDSELQDWRAQFLRLREDLPGLEGVLLISSTAGLDGLPEEQLPLTPVIWSAGASDQLVQTVKRLLDKQEQNARLITLAEMTANVSNAQTMTELMEATCKALVTLFQVDHSGFVEFDDDQTHGWAMAEYPARGSKGALIPVDNEGERQLVKDGKTFIAYDLAKDKRLGSVQIHLLGKGIQSILIEPVQVKNKVKASFSLDMIKRKRRFNPDEINLSRMIANQLGTAIENMRAREETELLREAAKAVQEISRISATGSYQETLQCIVDMAVSNLKVDIATLYTYDKDTNRFILGVGQGHKAGELIDPRQIAETSTLYRLLKSSSYEKTEDSSNDPTFKGGFVEKEEIQSSFGMPIRNRDETVGVMCINFRGPRVHHFREEEIQNYLEFGNQAAVIINNFQLSQENTKKLVALEGLYEMGSDLPENDMDRALKRIVDQAPKITQMTGEKDWGIAHIAVRENNGLRFRAASNPQVQKRLNETFKTVDLIDSGERIGIVGKAILENKTINVGNVTSEKEPYNRNNIPYDEDILSELVVPVRMGERVFGALTVESKRENAFNKEAVQNLEHLAVHAEAVIRDARRITLVKTLLELGQNMTVTRRLEDALTKTALLVRRFFNCDIVSIFTLMQSSVDVGQYLISYPAVISGNYYGGRAILSDPALLKEFGGWIPLNKFPARSVIPKLFRHGKPVYTTEGQEASGHTILGRGSFAERQKVTSAAGIPLKIKQHKKTDKLVGFLFLNYRDKHTFTGQEREEIEAFATYIGQAIEHYRRYDELLDEEWYFKEIRFQAWLNDYTQTWDNLVWQSATSIQADLNLIEQKINKEGQGEGSLAEELRELLSRMKESAAKLYKNAQPPRPREKAGDDQFYKYGQPPRPRLKASRTTGKPLRLDRLIQNLLRYYRAYGGVKIEDLKMLSQKDTFSLRADREWLQYGLENLFDYLMESMRRENLNGLRVEMESDESQLWVNISNTGLKNEPCRMSINRDERQDLLRYKLQAANAVFSLYGGRMNCHQDAKGAVFEIDFPRSGGDTI